ncbi:MAG: NHL repeat-containing protein [Candidatus Acidiferrales bacterium]
MQTAKCFPANRKPAGLLVLFFAILFAGCTVSRPQTTQQAAGPVFEFLGEWGIKGNEPGQLSNPKWISTDGSGYIFVADSGSGLIQEFDPQGHPLLAFSDRVPKNPFRVAVDSGEGIYSLSQAVNSICIFAPDGDWFRTIHLQGSSRRQWPQSLAIDSDGNIFVIEVLGNSEKTEIRKLTPRGRTVKSWLPASVSAGSFSASALAVSRDGNVFVVDDTTSQIQEYSSDGNLLASGVRTPGVDEPAQELRRGEGIGVTSEYIFTAAPKVSGVQVWTLSLQPEFQDDLGGKLLQGAGAYQIAVSPLGELLVLDPSVPRVLRFRIHL